MTRRLADEYTTDFGSGQVDAAAATRMPKTAVALLMNGRINPDNSISRRKGGRRTHANALVAGGGTPYGAITYRATDGTDQLLVFIDDSCWMSDDEGETWSDVTPETGGTSDLASGFYDFATMRIGAYNYLFAANGDATLWMWDGTSWAATANAPSGVKYVEVFNGRLAAAGHNGLFVALSAVNDPETWALPDGLLENVLAQDASEIRGLFTLGATLLIFSDESCSLMDGYGEQTLVIATGSRGLSRSVGCWASRSIAAVGDDGVCWLSGRGVEYFSHPTGIVLLSSTVQTTMETFNRALLRSTPGLVCGVYDAPNQNYELLLSTQGTRPDRVLVGNMQQNAMYQRQGPQAAFGFDDWATADAGSETLFAVDSNGYESSNISGLRLKTDLLGYEALASSGAEGVPIGADSDGYEDEVVNDAFPGTLFIGPSSETGTVVFSVGYDAFVRCHDGLDADDEIADGTGGTSITLRVVSRPFFFGNARQRKRVRVVHIASINDAEATIAAQLRVGGQQKSAQDVTIASTDYDQPKRNRVMVSGIGDSPQVEVTSTDRVRLTLIGVSAELLKERV